MTNYVILLSGGWQIAINIVVFLLALATLVTIHELGHFLVAKMFKVYCTDFSIGFGPKFVKIKRQKGETTFSIGAFPFGGYVAMVNSPDDDLVEGLNVPKERTIRGIRRWKRICIMLAGVTMNFILAYLLFFISVSCFPQQKYGLLASVDNEISQNYFVSETKFENNDSFIVKEVYIKDDAFVALERGETTDKRVYWMLSNELISNSNESDTKKYVAVVDAYFENGFENLDFSNHILVYEANPTPIQSETYGQIYVPAIVENQLNQYVIHNGDELDINILWKRATDHTVKVDENTSVSYEVEDGKLKEYAGTLKLKVKDAQFEKVGISFYHFEMWYGWRSFEVAGEYWVSYSQLIGRTIGGLFAGQNWDQIGGPVAMYTQSAKVLETSPFYMYIMLWGIVSINLGIVNLLPFPGLDGYQVVVELIEGGVNGVRKLKQKSKKKKEKDENIINSDTLDDSSIASTKDIVMNLGEEKKEEEWQIPPKVKTIVTFVGLGLLLALSIYLVISDVIRMVI